MGLHIPSVTPQRFNHRPLIQGIALAREELDSAWDIAEDICKKEKDARDSASPVKFWATADSKPAPKEKPYNAQDDYGKLEGKMRGLVITLVGAIQFGGGRPPSVDL